MPISLLRTASTGSPSVWLEPDHYVTDFRRELLFNVAHSTVKFVFTVSDGKVSNLPDQSEDCLVESVTQVIEGVRDNTLQMDWHGLNEFDLAELLSSIRIDLNDRGVWLTAVERENLLLKITKVMLCSRKS